MARRNKDEQDLLSNLRTQLQQCVGFDGDKIASDRSTAWRYYFQRPRGDEITGRSNVVSGDLSAMVDAVLSQMDDAFGTDRLVEFEAQGNLDVDQSQLESDTVCQFVGRSNGRLQLLAAIKSALLLRNGIVKVWVQEKLDTVNKQLTNVTPEAYSAFLAPTPGIEVKINEYDPEAQTLDLDVTQVIKKLRIDAIPMASFVYPDDWNSNSLEECPFMAERHFEERAKLRERGFSKKDIDAVQDSLANPAMDSQAQSPGGFDNNRTGLDESQKRVEWFEAYAYMGDGKGKSQRRRISFAHNVILENVVEDLVPYGAGVVFLNPNRFTGISLYDKLKSVQDVNTGLERALLDNVNTVNKNRVAYFDGVANVDDLSDGRTNNFIRVRQGTVSDIRAAIMPFTIPDNSSGILANIQDQKQRRSEMGGAALTLATGELQLSDRAGSQGIDRAFSVMEQLSSHMIRNIAMTLIRSVYLIAHETMRRNFDYPVTVRQGGRWKTTTPSQWPKRENCFVKVGMSPGERSRRVNMLQQMMTNQVALAQAGMDEVLVNMDGFYNTMIDWARAGDIENPERYYVDPQSPTALQALQNKQIKQKKQEETQTLLITQAIQLEQVRSAIQKYQTDVETQFKYYNANLQAQIEEAKIVGAAALDMIKMANPTPVEGVTYDGESDGGAEGGSEDAAGIENS